MDHTPSPQLHYTLRMPVLMTSLALMRIVPLPINVWCWAWVWPVLAFLVGSIPTGYLVARAHGMDIRTVGSGNIGMTNVWRTLGWPAGATVLVVDILKGLLPVLAFSLY